MITIYYILVVMISSLIWFMDVESSSPTNKLIVEVLLKGSALFTAVYSIIQIIKLY